MAQASPALTDFSDRLSPMVVKELRQGLRTRALTGTLLLLHLGLILITLMAGAAGNVEDTRWMYDGIATVTLCLVLPFRVSNAISEEVKLNTLDMLMLTRLSSGRIVFGKWAAVAVQSLLIAVSLLPYLVARYVLGGLELGTELLMLGSKWLAGILFAALLVMLSTLRQAWLRMILTAVPVFFGMIGVSGYFMFFLMSRASGGGTPLWGGAPVEGWMIALGLLFSAWIICACLSLAASRIAPPAEPLAWLKRLVNLAMFLTLLLVFAATRNPSVLAMASVVIAFLSLDVLTETLNDVPSAYAGFYRRGWLGRLAMPFLAPGWASGFWVTLAGTLLTAGASASTGGFSDAAQVLLTACTAWMISVLFQLLPTRHSPDPLPVFLVMVVLLYLLAGMVSGAAVLLARTSGGIPWMLAAFPPAALLGWNAVTGTSARESFLQTSLLAGSLWPLLHALWALRAWKRLQPVRQEARQLAAEP